MKNGRLFIGFCFGLAATVIGLKVWQRRGAPSTLPRIVITDNSNALTGSSAPANAGSAMSAGSVIPVAQTAAPAADADMPASTAPPVTDPSSPVYKAFYASGVAGKALSTDPASPSYNAFNAFFTKYHKRSDKVWASEPVSESWAKQRQADLLAFSEDPVRRIDPKARMEIECHTATCRVRIYSKSEHFTDAMYDYPFPCTATSATVGDGDDDVDAQGTPITDYFLIYAPLVMTREAFQTNIKRYCTEKVRDETMGFVK
jgi:hypothetical protein